MSPHAKAIEAAAGEILSRISLLNTGQRSAYSVARAAVVAFMKVELELGDRRTPGWGYLYDTICELEADRG